MTGATPYPSCTDETLGAGSLAHALCSRALHTARSLSVMVKVWAPELDSWAHSRLCHSATAWGTQGGLVQDLICKAGVVIAPCSGKADLTSCSC